MIDTPMAVYGSTFLATRYVNGVWFISRHEMFPHTLGWQDGHAITKQGHALLVGARKGEGGSDDGFYCRRWPLPDTEPHRVFRT